VELGVGLVRVDTVDVVGITDRPLGDRPKYDDEACNVRECNDDVMVDDCSDDWHATASAPCDWSSDDF